jgi:hypothetical protein
MFIYSSRGKWVFPPLLWSFPPTATFTSFLAPDFWACCASPASWHVCLQLMWEVGLPLSPVEFSSLHHSHKLSRSSLLGVPPAPALSGQAQLVYLQFWEGFPSPTFHNQGAPPSLVCVFLVLIAITQFLFFPLMGSVRPGGYADLAQGCLWKYHVPLNSPFPHLPMPSGSGRLAAWGPSWFLRLTWSGDSLRRLEVWKGQSFASSQWSCQKGVSPASPQDFTQGGTLSASSL